MKRLIKIHFQNGLDLESFKKDVFDPNQVSDDFDFIESDQPEFIVFGPYGNDLPKSGNYIRIGYFCENIIPDLDICEWAFGVPREEAVGHPRYKRIQWHGLNPQSLLKADIDVDKILKKKNRFCNFIFSNPVYYREEFFRQLSKYKMIDAPGKSMNNMSPIDPFYKGDFWQRKRQFLSEFKFTIAFENYCSPGYQTEKLYDPMLAQSVPIYCGDPYVNEIFNHNSFIDARNHLRINDSAGINFLERLSQPSFRDILPQFYRSPMDRIRRKLKSWGREFKMKSQFNKLDFSNLIEKIIEIDQNPDLYKKYLAEPWLKNNVLPEHFSARARWKQIFESGQIKKS